MHWTKTPGIGGEIKKEPQDFIVEEKRNNRVWTIDYSLLDRIKRYFIKGHGNHLHATMIKKNRTTLSIINYIASELKISRRAVGYAGLKDKRAITSQRISIPKGNDIKELRLRNAFLKDLCYEKKKIKIGHLQGNVFTIRIRDTKKSSENIFQEFKKYKKLPNLYGEQRFGGNAGIGKQIIKGNIKKAVELICQHNGYYEKNVRKLKGQPEKAIKKVPRKIMMLYKDAYQSHVFNRALEKYGWNAPKYLPLPGYKTDLDETTEKILSKDKIKKPDFRKNRMKGTFRKSFFEPNWLGHKKDKNDLVVRFFLPKGAYATTLLRELMKNG